MGQCIDNVVDNRESCGTVIPSSCVPHTGYVSPLIEEKIPCRPNINDINKEIQKLIEEIKESLGDNKTLDTKCTNLDAQVVKQSEINQKFIDFICDLLNWRDNLDLTVHPEDIDVPIDLSCLGDNCEPQATYTLLDILNRFLVTLCNHENRIKNIEAILNI